MSLKNFVETHKDEMQEKLEQFEAGNNDVKMEILKNMSRQEQYELIDAQIKNMSLDDLLDLTGKIMDDEQEFDFIENEPDTSNNFEER